MSVWYRCGIGVGPVWYWCGIEYRWREWIFLLMNNSPWLSCLTNGFIWFPIWIISMSFCKLFQCFFSQSVISCFQCTLRRIHQKLNRNIKIFKGIWKYENKIQYKKTQKFSWSKKTLNFEGWKNKSLALISFFRWKNHFHSNFVPHQPDSSHQVPFKMNLNSSLLPRSLDMNHFFKHRPNTLK